jgi:single-strand DNA-binding protein
MITQDVSKEEKAQGIKGNILGNGKVFWKEGGQAPQAQGGFQQQAPQQQQQQQQPARDPQGFTSAQGGFQQQAQQQQQAPKVNPQEPTIDFDDDIPF